MTTSTNPFAYGKPITFDTLGALFDHHRANLAGWRMEDDDAAKAAAQAAAAKAAADKAAADKADSDKFEAITSQADLDKIVGQRVLREREKYVDYDDLKKKAEAHDAAVEAAKTEAEKAVDAARKEGEATGRTAGNDQLIRAEARATAAELKFRNPAIAVATVDLTGVKVNDDGTVDAEAIKTKLQALATSDPYLVDDGKKGPKPDHSQGGGSGSGGERPGSIAEARERARAEREKKNKPKTA